MNKAGEDKGGFINMLFKIILILFLPCITKKERETIKFISNLSKSTFYF